MAALEYPVFCCVCIAFLFGVQTWLRRRDTQTSPRIVWAVLAAILTIGFFVTRNAEKNEWERLRSSLSFLAPTYAKEIELLHHEEIEPDSRADDPIFQGIIEAQKRWLRLNPEILDLYTWGKTENGRVVLLVDSENEPAHQRRPERSHDRRSILGKPYANVSEEIRRAFSGEALVDPRVQHDGVSSWVNAYAPLRNQQGEVTGVLGLEYDATRWTAAVAKSRWQWISGIAFLVVVGAGTWVAVTLHSLSILKMNASASEQRFQAYFDSLPFECWAMDETGHFWLFNRFARASRGHDYLGKTLSECNGLAPPESLANWEIHCRRAFSGETINHTFTQGEGPTLRHFHSIIAPVRAGDKIVGIVGTNLDITARVEADAARRFSENSLALHIRQTPLGVVEWDPSFLIKAWNPAVESIFNLPAEDAIGRNGLDLLFPPTERQQAEISWRELLLGRGKRHMEHIHIRGDGQRRLCEWHHTPLVDNQGTIVGLASFVQDITARSELENQMRQVQRLDSMGQLACGLAQELNHLFTPAIIHLDLLENSGRDDSTILDQVKPIREAFTQAAGLSQRILTLGRATDQEPLTWQCLNPQVHDTVELLRRSLDPRLRLIVLLAPDLPQLPLLPTVVTEIVINLLLNARDALMTKLGNPPSGWKPLIRISTSTLMAAPHVGAGVSGSPPRSCQCIEISDTGCGMSESIRERIFEPFFTTKASGHGDGLGLAITRKAIQAVGGWIEFDSTPGEGSTFRVFFPSPKQPQAIARAPALPSFPASDNPGKRILLAEDDDMVSRALTLGMKRAGHQVTCATDGSAALALIRLDPFAYDLVVTDLNMPNLGGRDLLAALARDAITIPVIVLSGHVTTAIVDELRLLGAAEVLRKPIRIGELLASIQRPLSVENSGELV